MKKISTLYKKDPERLSRVSNEINPENSWVFSNVYATRKYDGTASAIIDGEVYKRYDVKKGREVPVGAIPCQEPDEITGHHPHWVKCSREDNSDRYHLEAMDNNPGLADGTYELCGPKVQGNPEKLAKHTLVKHGADRLEIKDLSFDGLREYLTTEDIEGIVFHEIDGDRMCKIRKSDFGIKRIS